MSEIIIYCAKESNRLRYILDFIFTEVYACTYSLTQDIIKFQQHTAFKINYSAITIPESDIHIVPHTLLFETTVTPHLLEIQTWKEHPTFFTTSTNEIPFDIFAATFYLITRYEEYLPHEKDMYDRYAHTNSIAFKYNFLNLPLVDIWLQSSVAIINNKRANTITCQKKFTYLPTYDIDIAYSYIGKGFIRNTGGLFNDLLHRKYTEIKLRIASLFYAKKDPYNAYDFMDSLHKNCNLQPIYFFLLSNRSSAYDKNLDGNSSAMQNLVAYIFSKYAVGIHPSYASNNNIELLIKETSILKNISKSRQHYIKFTLPSTYHNLIACGITDDYSMGYGSINGFRASTSHSFLFFDIQQNKVYPLRVHPFCFMEANSFFEQKLTAQEALEEMLYYYNIIKKVQGTYITIWHNFSLGTDTLWNGWKEIYSSFLKEINS